MKAFNDLRRNSITRWDWFHLAWPIFLLYAAALPISLRFDQGYDDALFIQQGYSIFSGEWLGTYTNLTFIKGPMYPIFLALAAAFQIPITLAATGFHTFTVYIFRQALLAAHFPKLVVNATTLIVLFNPMLIPQQILRDYLNSSLLLLVSAFCIRLVFSDKKRRAHSPLIGLGLGFAIGIFSLTREESIWIAPLIFSTLLAFLYKDFRDKGIRNRKLIVLTLIGAGFVAPQVAVGVINEQTYGSFTLIERNSEPFSGAMRALFSAEPASHVDYIPVPENTRNKLYELSPAFAELKPYFENQGSQWTTGLCWIYKWTCGEYAGGWFEFALRDAVASKGYYSNPDSASSYYMRLKDEINSLCRAQRLSCSEVPSGAFPSLSKKQISNLPASMFAGLKKAAFIDQMELNPGISTIVGSQADSWLNFLGNPSYRGSLTFSGLTSIDPKSWFEIHCDGERVAIERLSSAELAEQFKNPDYSNSRFSFNVSEIKACQITLASGSYNLDLAEYTNNNTTTINFQSNEQILFEKLPGKNETNTTFSDGVRQVLQFVYSLVVPISIFIGTILFLFDTLTRLYRRERFDRRHGLVAIAWGLILARLGLLAAIDVSSFSAMHHNYLQPAILLVAVLAPMQILFFRPKLSATRGTAKLTRKPGTRHGNGRKLLS